MEEVAVIRRQAADTKRRLQFLAEVPRQYFELAFVVGIGLMIATVAAVSGASSVVAAVGLFAVAGFRLLPGLARTSNAGQALQSGLPAMELVLDALALPAPPPDAVQVAPGEVFRRHLSLRGVTFRYPGAPTDVRRTSTSPSARGRHWLWSARRVPARAPWSTSCSGCTGRSAARSPSTAWTSSPTWRAGSVRSGSCPRTSTCSMHHCARTSRSVCRRSRSTTSASTMRSGVRSSSGSSPACRRASTPSPVSAASASPVANGSGSASRVCLLQPARGARARRGDLRTRQRHRSGARGTIAGAPGTLTMVVIAHRLSTVRDADRLVLLEDRRIVDQGPFDELRARNAAFRSLVDVAHLE